jgi:hypothetical protein
MDVEMDDGSGLHGPNANYLLKEKWENFRNDLKAEFDLLASTHFSLQELDNNPDLIQNGMMGLFDEYYQVEGFDYPS